MTLIKYVEASSICPWFQRKTSWSTLVGLMQTSSQTRTTRLFRPGAQSGKTMPPRGCAADRGSASHRAAGRSSKKRAISLMRRRDLVLSFASRAQMRVVVSAKCPNGRARFGERVARSLSRRGRVLSG